MLGNADHQRFIDEKYVGTFDQDYIDDSFLDRLVDTVQALHPDIEEVADFGGGNGRFLDRLLQRISRAHGVNYEVSEHLRSLNTTGPGKSVESKSFLSIDAESQYDLVLMNWVLHHLIGDDLQDTVRLIQCAAAVGYRSLKPGGILVVSENILQSAFPKDISSTALYLISRSRLLKPITTRMRDGASVAGVGIYYLAEMTIRRLFSRFEHIATFDRNDHDYGFKLRLIGITRVTEKVLVFKRPLVDRPESDVFHPQPS